MSRAAALCGISVLTAALVATARAAPAVECFEPSPTTRATGDPYAPVEPSRLSSDVRRDLERLFAGLRGRWTGSASGFFCEGDGRGARMRADEGEMTLEIDAGRHWLSVRGVLESRARGTSRNETLRLYLTNSVLRVDRDDRFGDAKVTAVSPDRLEFLHKATIPGSGGTRARIEVARRIRLSGSSLTVEFEVYSPNGLASISTWNLRRR